MPNAGNSLDKRTLTLLAALGGGVLVLSLAVLVPAWGANRASEPAPFDVGEVSETGSADEQLARLDEREAQLDALADEMEASRAEIAAARESVRSSAPVLSNDDPAEPVASAPPVPAAASSPSAAPFPRRSAESEAPRVIESARPAVSVEPVLVTLGAGTLFEVELLDAISSDVSAAGDPVSAVVTSDVVEQGLVVVPAGSRLSGRVEDAVSQKKIGGQARLVVGFDRLELGSGESVPVSAFLALEGEKATNKDAAIMAGSTAGGALLGRVLKKSDKSKGTLIGAVVGAAVGTAIAAKNDKVVIEMPAGSVASLSLDTPVQIAVARPASAMVAETR